MKKFLLLDLETTGLDAERCQVLEVSARILGPGEEHARYHSLVGMSEDGYWDSTAKVIHKTSGLFDEVMACEKKMEDVDKGLWELLTKHGPDTYYLMGSSVYFDRLFIARHLPLVYSRLDHRQLDITSIRLWFMLMSGKDPMTWEKKDTHRAEWDVEHSLKEAVAYWQRR